MLKRSSIMALMIALLTAWSNPLLCKDAALKIHVPAGSKASMYIASIPKPHSEISLGHLNYVETLIRDDFTMQNLAIISDKQPRLELSLVQDFHKTLKDVPAEYAMIFSFEGKQFHARAFKVTGKKLMAHRKCSLNLERQHDRHAIHTLTDLLHYDLFGEYGIASCRILYSCQKEPSAFKSEVFLTYLDHDDPVQITETKSACLHPIFFPSSYHQDNQSYLFVGYQEGLPKLFLNQVDSSNPKRLIPLSGSQILPAIARKGEWVAFISDATSRVDVFMQSLTKEHKPLGKPIQVFSDKHAVQASPAFHPKEQSLAIVSDKTGSPSIYEIDISRALSSRKNPDLKPITSLKGETICPSYSPDGVYVVFSAKKEGVRQLWIYDRQTKKEYPITDTLEDKENPYWSANGKFIIFNTTKPTTAIKVLRLEDKTIFSLKQTPGLNHYPSWEYKR